MRQLLVLLCCASWSLAFTGSDDRFVKKYAMMKVYESCFGPDVVREVRQEMRAASAKCQADRVPPPPPPPPPHRPARPPAHYGHSQGDAARLQQALMAVLNRQAQGGFPAYRPISPGATASAHQSVAAPAAVPPPVAAPASGYSSGPGFSASASGLTELLAQLQAVGGPAQAASVPVPVPVPVQAPAPPQSPGIYQAMPHVDPLQALQALQTVQQFQTQSRGGFYQPTSFYQQPYANRFSRSSRNSKSSKAAGSSSARASRDLDIQGQLETLTTRMTGRVKNVTCVMQELGYLDSNLEPDFDRISARIARLPVPSELRRDMQDGMQFCRQFSQCIPDSRRDKFLLSGELLRPMFFFRCYKHKKLEACIMKDVRERYQQTAAGTLEDNVLPNTRAMDLNKNDPLDEDHMAAAVYEFLYGDDSLDGDSFF